MTNDQWLAGANPYTMLIDVTKRCSERELRLYITACARLVWEKLKTQQLRMAVELAELFANGLAPLAQLNNARSGLYQLPIDYRQATGSNWFTSREKDEVAAFLIALTSTISAKRLFELPSRATWAECDQLLGVRQLHLLHDIFDWLYITPVVVAPCLPEMIIRYTQTFYQNPDHFSNIELASMLTQYGGVDDRIINHCLQHSFHVRGCWAIDLILGKRGT